MTCRFWHIQHVHHSPVSICGLREYNKALEVDHLLSPFCELINSERLRILVVIHKLGDPCYVIRIGIRLNFQTKFCHCLFGHGVIETFLVFITKDSTFFFFFCSALKRALVCRTSCLDEKSLLFTAKQQAKDERL